MFSVFFLFLKVNFYHKTLLFPLASAATPEKSIGKLHASGVKFVKC